MGAPRLVHEQLAHQRVDVVAELVGGLQLLGAPWERPAECRDDGLDEAVREVPTPANNDTGSVGRFGTAQRRETEL